jgi:tetratricopeptide (TPR) repeat protein
MRSSLRLGTQQMQSALNSVAPASLPRHPLVMRLVFSAVPLLLVFSGSARAQGSIPRQPVQESFALHVRLHGASASLVGDGKAAAQYRGAGSEVPANFRRRFKRALAYFRKRDFTNATQQFAALHEEVPDNARVAALLGDSYVHLRRYDQAIALLAPLEKAHGDNLDFEWAMGTALVGAGQLHEGVARVEKVAQQGHRAQAYLLAAEVYLKLTFYKRARTNADAAVRLDPNLPGVFTVSGIIDTFWGDKKEAESAFEKALQVNPDDAEAHLQLGVVFYTEQRLDSARKQLDRALDLEPSSVFALYELARVERTQGHLQAAARYLEKAVRAEPQWLAPHIELAAIYYLLKRPTDGAREREIVDRLMAEEQRREAKAHTISPKLPSP